MRVVQGVVLAPCCTVEQAGASASTHKCDGVILLIWFKWKLRLTPRFEAGTQTRTSFQPFSISTCATRALKGSFDQVIGDHQPIGEQNASSRHHSQQRNGQSDS